MITRNDSDGDGQPRSVTRPDAAGSPHTEHAKVAVMTSSVVAAILASFVLVARSKLYKKLREEYGVDVDKDGIPDVYQREESGA